MKGYFWLPRDHLVGAALSRMLPAPFSFLEGGSNLLWSLLGIVSIKESKVKCILDDLNIYISCLLPLISSQHWAYHQQHLLKSLVHSFTLRPQPELGTDNSVSAQHHW